YHALQAIRRDFRVWNDVVLVNGDLRIDVSVQGRRKTVYSRYLQVWRRGPQDWQMASWQSTPLPAPGQAGT
ncbi:MAG TPA: hypothetical protein VM491_22210, partial [Burkholderiaceae bacterium]|nr:hypothetical protein [Burkholderiaceae bacterium]